MKRFCEICENKDIERHILHKKLNCQLLKCKVCGFIFTEPFTKNMEKYYNSEEHTYAKPDKQQIIKRENFLRNIFFGFKEKFKFQKINYLDIGCGTGGMLKIAKEFGWNIYGCDISKSVIKMAKKYSKVNKIYLGDITKCKFQDSFFDFITMNHVIEHLVNLNNQIKEIERILKPGGIIFIRCPNYKNIRCFWDRKKIIKQEHVNYFTNKDLIRLFEKHNFKVIQTPKTNDFRFDIYNKVNHKLNYRLDLFEIFITFKNIK
jgi:2-polyprenyl-3-methyl-5-hydroxy-6-metoxy-1,4-benzoquinol methylase